MEKKDGKSADDTKCKVLIIGAGMAGLSAAYHLSKNGFNDYKILEARKRVGGRIVQIKMGNEAIELGANWIHGVLGNPVYELAMQNGLVDIMHTPKPHKIIAATENGKQVPFAVLHEIYEAYLCFLKRCEEYFLSQYLPPDGIDSVGEHINLEITLYLDKFQDSRERHLRELLFLCLLKRETCICGCDDMNEIDLLELGTYTELQGGNVSLPEGYSAILKPMTNVIPSENLFLEHSVRSICWGFNRQTSSGNDSDDSDRTVIEGSSSRESSCEKTTLHKNNVEVKCDNGKMFECDLVICTIPLGVLKAKKDKLFKPLLPDYKRESIDRLLFGTVDKILLEYDRPFLNPNISEILLLWETDSTPNNDLSKSWFKKIYSFAKVTETILLGWITGKEAEFMETLSKDIVTDVCTCILRKFLNDPFIPKPKNVVCTSWHEQPYTRGSYTAIAVGASQIDIECLAQPLFLDDEETEPVVLFAGEHTHSNFYSTVHGAYLTGRTAAQTILNASAPQELILEYDEEDADLSTWIQGISLE